MKIENINEKDLYMYPCNRYGSIGYRIGRATRINIKTVVFDCDTKINVENLDEVYPLSEEEVENYKSFIIFQNRRIEGYYTLLKSYNDLFKKCKKIQEVSKEYKELNVDWEELQNQIDTLTSEIKKITEPLLEANGHKFYLNTKDMSNLMFEKGVN